MRQCVVVGCEEFGVDVVAKPTSWGVWEYRVCSRHWTEVDNGAFVEDNPDGWSITLRTPAAAPIDRSTDDGAADHA